MLTPVLAGVLFFFLILNLPSIFDGGDPSTPENQALLKSYYERREASHAKLRSGVKGLKGKTA